MIEKFRNIFNKINTKEKIKQELLTMKLETELTVMKELLKSNIKSLKRYSQSLKQQKDWIDDFIKSTEEILQQIEEVKCNEQI